MGNHFNGEYIENIYYTGYVIVVRDEATGDNAVDVVEVFIVGHLPRTSRSVHESDASGSCLDAREFMRKGRV